jgi:lipopolysaccharide export LptBFGC system permease protein LptF
MPLKLENLFAKQGSASSKDRALAEFWRIIALIAVLAVVMVAAALLYLGLTGELDANLVIATTLGVFFSVLLGCGLFAAAFFSDKSGHDQAINDSTKRERRD